MKKDSKIATLISLFSIGLGVLIFLDILPFLFVWASLVATNSNDMILLQKKAIKTSTFKFQKIYTRTSALSSLYLTENYDDVIKYYGDLEKLNSVDNMSTLLVINSYLATGNFDKALEYAKTTNKKSILAKVYIKRQEFDKAKPIVEEMLQSNKKQLTAYLYKAEILIHENKWNEAESYVNKILNSNQNYLEALYLKAKILQKQNKPEEAKKFESRAKIIELKRSSLYK
jgi:tetratricopeptide (TPR) repeat protein